MDINKNEGVIRKNFEELEKVCSACLRNAADLLKSARVLLDQDVDHICYHLATLALEEIGKTTLLRTKFSKDSIQQPEAFSISTIDDHIKKLFWALWTPFFGKLKITSELMNEYKGMARMIHERRLRSLYVDPETFLLTEDKVTHEEAGKLLNLAESRLGLELSKGTYTIDEETADISWWFIDATEDPAKRRYMFGNESMNKLVELGDGQEWIKWLRSYFDKLESQAREMVEKELNRSPVSPQEADEPRWRLKIRIHSASHSIRPKFINKWNELSTGIVLYPTKNKEEFVCQFTLLKALSMQNLWGAIWDISRVFIYSLNMATNGFFWWYLPKGINSLYEEIFDLENNQNAQIEETNKFKDNWDRLVLSEKDIRHIHLFFLYLTGVRGTIEEQALAHYGAGLTLIAKSDPQLNLYINAFLEFFKAFKAGLYVNKHWDGKEDIKVAAQRGLVDEKEEEITDLGTYIQLGIDVEQGRRLDEVKSKEVIQMKSFYEVYSLVRLLKKLEDEKDLIGLLKPVIKNL